MLETGVALGKSADVDGNHQRTESSRKPDLIGWTHVVEFNHRHASVAKEEESHGLPNLHMRTWSDGIQCTAAPQHQISS